MPLNADKKVWKSKFVSTKPCKPGCSEKYFFSAKPESSSLSSTSRNAISSANL